MDSAVTGLCIWLAGMFSGIYLGAADAKDKTPRHIVAVVLGPLGVALTLAFCISMLLALAPYVDMDVMAQSIVEFFQ